ncbi:phosphotransferase family protein [Kitasatospora sp. NPDC092286]|uniref:phosphotransferase family protein n=1 Tax=Kitasatospora sp. NPDC092286 TaxID=3364087 RepID=UPI00381B292B
MGDPDRRRAPAVRQAAQERAHAPARDLRLPAPRTRPRRGRSGPDLPRRGHLVAARRHHSAARHPGHQGHLGPAEEREAYRQAGLLAARIHTHPTSDGVVGERLPWSKEREGAFARARDAQLSDEDVEVPAEATRIEPRHTALTTCHGDFGPRNWLVRRDDDGRLIVGVIDFERSQVEEPVRRGLMRVVLQLTPHRPDLRTAFLSGYGRELTPASGRRAGPGQRSTAPPSCAGPWTTTTTTRRSSATPAPS